MAITYKIESEGEFLKVVAKGKDDDLEDVTTYSNAVIDAAIDNKSKRILCDERGLEYSISVIDTYRLAESTSVYARSLSKIAIVCDPRYLLDGKFYETVASNRGLFVRVTADFGEAMEWLNNK